MDVSGGLGVGVGVKYSGRNVQGQKREADPYGMTSKEEEADPYGMTSKEEEAKADPYGMTSKMTGKEEPDYCGMTRERNGFCRVTRRGGWW